MANKLKEVAKTKLTSKFGDYVNEDAITDFLEGNDVSEFIIWDENSGVEYISELSLEDSFIEYNSHLLEDGGYWGDE